MKFAKTVPVKFAKTEIYEMKSMQVKKRVNFHSISIKMQDQKQTVISISIGHTGFGIRASMIPGAEPNLKGYVNGIHHAMKRYLGDKVNLCGCKNYGQFADLIVSTVTPAQTWEDVIKALVEMGRVEKVIRVQATNTFVFVEVEPPEFVEVSITGINGGK